MMLIELFMTPNLLLSVVERQLDYAIGSRLVTLEYVGLGNIMFSKMSGKALHEEFLQDAVTVENLYSAYERMDREKFLEDAKALRGYLDHGSSSVVAGLINS